MISYDIGYLVTSESDELPTDVSIAMIGEFPGWVPRREGLGYLQVSSAFEELPEPSRFDSVLDEQPQHSWCIVTPRLTVSACAIAAYLQFNNGELSGEVGHWGHGGLKLRAIALYSEGRYTPPDELGMDLSDFAAGAVAAIENLHSKLHPSRAFHYSVDWLIGAVQHTLPWPGDPASERYWPVTFCA